MTLKDLSRVVGTSSYVIICSRTKFDNNVTLHQKSNMLLVTEFKELIEKSDTLANMLVECVFARDNNLYIVIY